MKRPFAADHCYTAGRYSPGPPQRGLFLSMDDILDFDKQGGLIPAVVQDANTHRVLMVGYMNREAFERTIETGHVTFFSRSRQELWTKGGSSGHYLNLKSIAVDCDGDALLVEAEPIGPGVCHNGYYSCFFRTFEDGGWVENEQRVYDPAAIYGMKK
ncbi:MAG TPA: phosphoribosyl-AMP cyclohydrolase [Bryobacteraceae bacterium]|nr:phosphoribosyl-AMP cyclohydrolase [Bryobacteraceae bacterium]